VIRLLSEIEAQLPHLKPVAYKDSTMLISAPGELMHQVLLDAAERADAHVGVSRWAGAYHESCDLQSLGVPLSVGERRTYVLNMPLSALRVSVVREAVRHVRHGALVLQDSDAQHLNRILSSIDEHTPQHFKPQNLMLLAPQ
jgi:hypothetical protein